MDPECSLSPLLGYNSVCARVYVSACGALGYVRGGILCCFVGGDIILTVSIVCKEYVCVFTYEVGIWSNSALVMWLLTE